MGRSMEGFMHFKMLLLPCLLALTIGAAGQAAVPPAPDQASKEDIRKLFDVMASREQMSKVMEQVFAQMRTMERQQLKQRHPEITQEEVARFDRESQDLIKNFPLDEMLNDMVPIYQRHFTKADIDALTTFYSSPTGQKFLRETPAVAAETLQSVYPRIQAAVDAAMKRAEEKSLQK